MMANEDTKRYSMAELTAMRERGETRTRADAPTFEIEEDFWTGARIVEPKNKISVTMRMDADVLDWFKAQGKGHQTRMNAVLRSYMEAHKQRGA
jgi:uncharacterized protein (DUF4415 family)